MEARSMPLRKRNQNTVKDYGYTMQEDKPYPTTKYDTGSHDKKEGGRQYSVDNSGQSTQQDWIATLYDSARCLDALEIKLTKVVFAVIAFIVITGLLGYVVVNRRYDVSANTPDERIGNLEGRVSDIDNRIVEFKSDIDKIKTKLETETPCQQHVNKLEKEIGNLDKKFQDEMRARKEKKIDDVLKVQKDLESLQQKVNSIDQDWKDHIGDSSQKISNLQTRVEEINNINNKLDTLKKSVRSHSETLSNVNSQLKFQEEVHLETRKGHGSSFLRNDYAILIVFVVGVLILILFVMVCKRQNVHFDRGSSFVEAATRPVSRNVVSSRSVLDQIQRQPLSDEVCIISFYTSTQPLHRRLASSAISDISIKTAVIEKHENILTLPHVKTFLVFVDFNERNIILEDLNREIGDLKLTTVQGALKLGGNVYVIYVRDNGSKALLVGNLINPKLTSINNHSLLRTLNQENKVLTTYDEFTPYQRQYLKRNMWR